MADNTFEDSAGQTRLTGQLKGPAKDGAPPTGPAGGSLDGSYPDPGIAAGAVGPSDLAAGAAAANVGALGGDLSGTLPSPAIGAGKAAANVGALGGDLSGTLPNPAIGAGKAAANVGALGGALSGTLPNPAIAALQHGSNITGGGTLIANAADVIVVARTLTAGLWLVIGRWYYVKAAAGAILFSGWDGTAGVAFDTQSSSAWDMAALGISPMMPVVARVPVAGGDVQIVAHCATFNATYNGAEIGAVRLSD